MSYAVHPPATAAPPPAADLRRPASVGLASVLLIVMALAGLGYAVATLAIAPGTVDRFRTAAGAGADVDGYVTVIWIAAALAAVLAVILFALYVVLALGLRRGSNGFRIAVLVVCALGLAGGCVSAAVAGLQGGGESAPGSIGAALTDAYPAGWISLNIGLAIAQIVAYALVGGLLLAAPRAFFGRAPKPTPPDPFAANSLLPQPGYAPTPGGYAVPGGYPGYAAPQQPMYGAPYPSSPPVASAPVENPGEPSPWAAPSPVTPTVPPAQHQPSGPDKTPAVAPQAPAPVGPPAAQAEPAGAAQANPAGAAQVDAAPAAQPDPSAAPARPAAAPGGAPAGPPVATGSGAISASLADRANFAGPAFPGDGSGTEGTSPQARPEGPRPGDPDEGSAVHPSR